MRGRGRDVFLCHAAVDKVTHGRVLYRELNRLGLSCWIDEAEIRPGDSIIAQIDAGLATSRYVLVIVTENFLGRRGVETELNAALSREIRTGVTHVVAVLDVDPDKFAEKYPLLAHKLYLTWSDGLEVLAGQVKSLFRREPAPEWHCDHPKAYVGPVWVRVMAAAENAGAPHKVVLRWGSYTLPVEVPPNSGPTSLAHHKTQPDSVTLHVSVTPSAVVTFGSGAPPDEGHLNIDEGWTRSSSDEWD
ncbi:toll/interleukin-1 receptor domain-containing protein [Streptomyces sp. ID05-26A]|nr:toll/interleukin-1 receptor domain-containing protein [Streptomyces sp. ID05-26A]